MKIRIGSSETLEADSGENHCTVTLGVDLGISNSLQRVGSRFNTKCVFTEIGESKKPEILMVVVDHIPLHLPFRSPDSPQLMSH